MSSVSIATIFEGEDILLQNLVNFLNIPIPEVRDGLVKAFCNHPQMKPLLDKHDLLPDYFYYMLMAQL